MSYCKVILLGRVGKDPQTKEFQSGAKVVRFSLATGGKNKKGEDQTQWHDIEVWNEGTRKFIEQYVSKGDQILVEGSIKYRSYEDDNGVRHDHTDIVCYQVQKVGGSKKVEQTGTQVVEKRQPVAADEDELPF